MKNISFWILSTKTAYCPIYQRPECNIHITWFLCGEVQSSPVSSLGFSPCKNVVRLLRNVCEDQHHLLLNTRSKTSLSQFSCCQTDGTRGLGLWGRLARLTGARRWRREAWGRESVLSLLWKEPPPVNVPGSVYWNSNRDTLYQFILESAVPNLDTTQSLSQS